MPSNQDLFADIEEFPVHTQAQPVSNRQRAIQQKQRQTQTQMPFDNFEIPEAVQQQINRGGATVPQVSVQKKGRKQAVSAATFQQSAMPDPFAADAVVGDDEELRTPKDSIIDRIRSYFSNNNSSQVLNDVLNWIRDHVLWFALVAVVLITIGLIVSRYISFGGAIAFLLIGWIINFHKQVEDTFAFYVYALLVFIIPYLF